MVRVLGRFGGKNPVSRGGWTPSARKPSLEPDSPWEPAAASDSYAAETTTDTVGLAEFGAILRRRWKIIAATTLLFSGLGMTYAMIGKPNYIASTSIFVDPRNRASFQIEGTQQGAAYDVNIVDSQIQVIQSDTVLSRVIAAEKLAELPEFSRGASTAAANALYNLKEAIKVKRPDRTYVVEVQVRTKNAALSARIANAVANAYLSDASDSKSATAEREGNWLDTHLAELQTRLKEAEARVDAYKTENRIIGVEGRLIGEQQLSEINRGLVEAQRKAAEAKSVLDQVEELKRSGRLPDATNEALRSGVIERLRGQLSEVLRLEANARSTLGPRHPAAIEIREQVSETRRQITEELNRIAEGARAGHNLARSNVAALEKQLDLLKRDTTSTNQRMLRLRELERAVDAQKAVFEKFLRDKEQIARLNVDTPAGRVIAPANVPNAAAFPSPVLIGMMASVAGLFAGIGAALVVETLSTGGAPQRHPAVPRRPQPGAPRPAAGSGIAGLSRRLGLGKFAGPDPGMNGLEPLAILPPPVADAGTRWLSRQGKARPAPVMLDAPRRAPGSDYAREIVTLAERLAGMVEGESEVTILISSLEPGAGSAVLTANLGYALAQAGHRVLLVDGTARSRGLAGLLPVTGETVEVALAGQPRSATRSGLHRDLLLLDPTSRRATGGRRMGCSLVLIDGPPFGSPELDRIDIASHVDGVIALAPAHVDPTGAGVAARLEARFGGALMGIVGQAA